MTYNMLNRIFRLAHETDLHCGENHTPVYVLELRHDTFTYVFALFFILHNVSAQRIENGHPTPLGTLVKGDEELAQNGTRYFEKAWVGWRRARLRHGSVVDVG